MDSLQAEFLCDLNADLEAPQLIGTTPRGTRRIVYVKGGTFDGPKLKGRVLPGGGDWVHGIFDAPPDILQRFRQGERDIDPSLYYFRTSPVFETGSDKYGWLNRIVTVGVGRRTPTGVAYRIYAVL